MRKSLSLVFAFCFSMLLGINVMAQETTSEIQGSVTDGKAGVSGAAVTAIHLPTGTRYVTTTRKDGRYNLPNVKVGGPYIITSSFVGYKEDKIENVFLSLGQEFRADFKLSETATVLTDVTVNTTKKQDKIFNTGRTGTQEIISRTQIEQLPTINRSIQDFVKLEPTANGMNIGGRSNQYNNMTVDGANFNNSFGLSSTLGGQTNSQPISLEAIDQIQVNISPFDVRQGGFSGTGINTVTKSGTNQFKGSVYYYFKNENLQGYKVGDYDGTSSLKTPITYDIKGASLGGAIVKNKVFFFASYEQVRQSLPSTSWIPSDASHPVGSAGNVSAANADTLTALSQFLQTKFGYDPGAYTGFNFKTNSDKATIKLDWNINSKNTFTLKYNYLKSNADQFASTSRPGTGQVTGGQPGANSMPFFGSGYVINNNFNIYIAELNTRFSNKASNKLQIGYTALRDFRAPHSSSATFPLVDIFNASGNIMTTFGYEPYTYNNVLNTDVYQFSDVFTMYKGSHEITLGTQDYYRKYQNAFAPGYQGVYQFNSLYEFYNSVNNGGVTSKNYYLQYSALPGGTFPWAYAGSTELGFFAQDKWRASKNFTLTYGVRVDHTIYKQSFDDNPYFDALKFKDGASYNIGKAPKSVPVISPRIGFNWDVVGDKSLQIRGGLGVFLGPPPFVWISNQASNNGIQFGSFTKSGVAFNQDPNAYRPTAGAANTAYSTAMVAENFKYPTVLKTSLAMDKRFADNWIFTLEAAYNRDINAVNYANVNLNESNGFALSNGGDTRTRYLTSVYSSNKYYYSKPTSSSSANNTVSDPNLGSAILMNNNSKGFSAYLTARIQKQTKNFFGSLSYTYSQAMNTAEGGSTASSLWSAVAVSNQDPNSPNLGYASYLQPHRIVAVASYKFNYSKHFATSIGGFFEVANNGAVSYVYNGDLNGDGNTGNDLIYIPKYSTDINLVAASTSDTRTPAQIWAQLDAFINASPYLSKHRGEYAERNAVVLPYYNKFDLNVTQDIMFKTGKDTHTLKISVDLINAGNLFNRNWGITQSTTVTNFLQYKSLLADGKTPTFAFPYVTGTSNPFTAPFQNSTGIGSRWQMQIGVRYLFN